MSSADEARPAMQKAVDFLAEELAMLRTSRANPALVSDLSIDSYGNPTPLKQIAQISTPDAVSIVVTPWDKSLLGAIEAAITKADLGLQPVNDGTVIRLNLPPMTEERRREMTKVVGEKLEAARVSLRNIRHDAITAAEKEGLSEDELKHRKEELTKLAGDYGGKLEALAEAKKKEIMTI